MIIDGKEYTKGVAYYRVSTGKQQREGTSLTTQQQDVKRFARERGIEIVAEHSEAKSGTGKRKRPEFDAAVQTVKDTEGSILIISKLDRLARNTYIFSKLDRDRVPFVAADMPEANSMMIAILSVMAEYESKQIGSRVKRAWAYKKEQDPDFVPGSTKGITDDMRQKGADTKREAARAAYQKDYLYAKELQKSGMSLTKIAERFNSDGLRTRQGAEFKSMTIKRILDRGAAEEEQA